MYNNSQKWINVDVSLDNLNTKIDNIIYNYYSWIFQERWKKLKWLKGNEENR